MALDLETALSAYARMINTRDMSNLEPLLADDFHYASQNVLDEITSKSEYVAYMAQKLRTMDGPEFRPFAEMGDWPAYGGRPCVILAQGDRENLAAVAVAELKGDLVSRIDICVVPPPATAKRYGIYPS